MSIIKPEKVNKFEFLTSTDKGKTIVEDKANVTVKINNVVKEIHWYEKYVGNDVYEIEGKFKDQDFINTLTELGIELDLTDLKNEYEKLLNEKKADDEQRRKDEKKYEYDHSWIHETEKEIKELADKEIKVEKEKYNPENPKWNKNDYVIIISYKGYEIFIQKHFVYNDLYSSKSKKDVGYEFSHSTLTDYKRRCYKKLDTMISKIKELVDNQIENDKISKQNEIERNAEKEEKFIVLRDVLGVEIEEKEEYKYSHMSRKGYYIKHLVAKVTDEIKINVDLTNEKDIDSEEKRYNRIILTGIGTFTFEKARKIIDVIKE